MFAVEVARTIPMPEEAQSGRDKEVILTWGAWQRLFHGNPSVIGTNLRVSGEPKTIVGVMPKAFRFPVMSVMPGQATFGSTERYEVFKPLVPDPEELTANDGDFNFLVVARLKPGVSVQQAQSELDGIEKATAAADHRPGEGHPGSGRRHRRADDGLDHGHLLDARPAHGDLGRDG